MAQNLLDTIYREKASGEIPWNRTEPPKALVELISKNKITPCKTIDLGCGLGNYSRYLAEQGFETLGIDFSEVAIEKAISLTNGSADNCEFKHLNILDDLNDLKETFDFALEWEVLHHIFPQRRKQFTQNVHKVLKKGGKYLSVCFSDEDPCFGGIGKVRKTPLGTTLYFSSIDEIRDLFEPLFKLIEIKTLEVPGMPKPHLAIYAFMEKK